MTLSQIKSAVDQGEAVYWGNKNYQVIKNKFGDYVIYMAFNKHEIGLTWADGVTMNGAEEDFFTEKGRNKNVHHYTWTTPNTTEKFSR